MEGLLGLTQSVGKREAATRDLAMLERMDQSMQQEQQAELQAQQQEAMLYEKMYAEADKMLGKDRARINQKILMSQRNVSNYLAKTGGSKQNFMANGGLSLVNNMGNEIVQSEEAIRYKQNKENLAHILRVKEKGLGHLLTPTDRANLEAYERNEEGTAITYSGVMAEVEIPPSNLFDYGTAITPKDVLDYGSNAMKIRANYQMSHPDDPDPSYADLVAFAKKMKYGGLGSNTTRMREQAMLMKKKMEMDAKKSQDPDTNRSFMYAASRLREAFPSNMTVAKLKEGGENTVEALKKGNPFLNEMLGDKFVKQARRRELGYIDESDSFGPDFGEFIDYFAQDKWGLQDSYRLALTGEDQGKLVKAMTGVELEDGTLKDFVPDGQVYAADGSTITGDDRNNIEKYRGTWRPAGMVTAMKSKVANTKSGKEEDILVMNAYDDDGTFDKEATDKYYSGRYGDLSQSEAMMTYVMAFENEEGDLMYKEVDLNQSGIQNALKNSIKSTDDITGIYEQREEEAKAMAKYDQITAEEKANFQTTKRQMEKTVFADGMFKAEGEEYYGANSAGQQNRHEMMKSFYLAFDYVRNSISSPGQEVGIRQEGVQQAIDNNAFSTYMEIGGINEDLKNYDPENREEAMIYKWLENVNKGEKEGSATVQQNRMLAARWKQILGIN